MLILSRQRDESIIITMPDGRRITVAVVAICGDKIKLGIDAPVDVPVHRQEVQEAIEKNGRHKR